MTATVSGILAGVIAREGGYSDNPDDLGGPTMWGITEAVAREWGYTGDMRDLPRDTAMRIYRKRYVEDPGFAQVLAAPWCTALGEELIDTGVNMGVAVAAQFLQRCLNAFNRKGELYADLAVDGAIGPVTLKALESFIGVRGSQGAVVLRKAVDCLQGARYIELCEAREANETFVYGWIKDRIG